LDFLLFGGPLKNFQAGQDFEITTEIKHGENFKGLSPSTTPYGKRKFIRIVESNIPETITLSIPKMRL